MTYANHKLWKRWHIYDVRDLPIVEDGETYRMLDGIRYDDIPLSMRLRAMSETKLQAEQRSRGWDSGELANHLSGSADDLAQVDQIYTRLDFNDLTGEAYKFIPWHVLNNYLRENYFPSDSASDSDVGYWRLHVTYATNRFLGGVTVDMDTRPDEVVYGPLPKSNLCRIEVAEISQASQVAYNRWESCRERGSPPALEPDEPRFTEGTGEFGGYVLLARGEIDVVVAAASSDEAEAMAEDGLPTAFEPADFFGPTDLDDRF